MRPVIEVVEELLNRYDLPPALQDQLRQDLTSVLELDRQWLNSALQAEIAELRLKIERLLAPLNCCPLPSRISAAGWLKAPDSR